MEAAIEGDELEPGCGNRRRGVACGAAAAERASASASAGSGAVQSTPIETFPASRDTELRSVLVIRPVDRNAELPEGLVERREVHIAQSFAPEGAVVVARAPGRFDVFGGISDYAGGLVLGFPIGQAAGIVVGTSAGASSFGMRAV